MNTTTTQPTPAASAPSASPGAQRVDVLIVGGGFGGMYAVYRFREMGLRVQAFEAGGDLGGVWYWNRYPGARVDLPSIDYSYAFSPEIEQEWTWDRQVARLCDLYRVQLSLGRCD